LFYFFLFVEQGHGWGYRYFHSAWLVLPLLAAAAFARVPARAEDDWSTDRAALVYVVACAVLSFAIANVQRGLQINELISAHLAQAPHRAGAPAGPRVEIYDATQNFYVNDMVQNDPFLRDPVIRAASYGAKNNQILMSGFRPNYVLTHRDQFGEVWEPAPH
jgi:hypothetical protein